MIAIILHSSGLAGLLVPLVIVALVIYVIFYVLPLPPPVRTILAVVIALALVLWLLGGCSTNPINREFRRNVSEVNTSEQVSYDPQTGGASGQFGQSFTLRNPDDAKAVKRLNIWCSGWRPMTKKEVARLNRK